LEKDLPLKTEKKDLERLTAIDELFDVCIEEGLERICLQLVDLGISKKKIDLMIEIYLNAGDAMMEETGILKKCLNLAQKGASARSIDLVIAKCLKLGKLEYLPVLLKVAGRELTVEEIESIHKHIPVWIEMNRKFAQGKQNLNTSLERFNDSLVSVKKG
jgi:hypothetical protein